MKKWYKSLKIIAVLGIILISLIVIIENMTITPIYVLSLVFKTPLSILLIIAYILGIGSTLAFMFITGWLIDEKK